MDVLRANHHGSEHSTNSAFMVQLDPTLTIFSVGDHNNFGHVSPSVLQTSLDNSESVILTEIGADVVSADDLCSTTDITHCASVADEEFPVELESDEIDDPGVYISVALGGFSYGVNTYLGSETQTFESK